MRIKPLSTNFKAPIRSTEFAGGFDLYMPEAGKCLPNQTIRKYGLGFAAAVPKGHVAIIVPRSGKGANFGVKLNNTVGIIDSDYRGEWIVAIDTRKPIAWKRHDRIFQYIIVPVNTEEHEITDTLDDTARDDGGFGSTDIEEPSICDPGMPPIAE